MVNANDAARRLNNEVRLFESGTMRDAVAEVYDGPLDPRAVQATAASDTSDVVKAHVTAADPDAAAELVNLYADTFVEVRRQQRTDELLAVGSEIQGKIDDLAARIAEVRQPLTDLEARLAADPGDTELQEQRDDLAGQLAPALTPLEGQRSFYESQIEDLELTADIARHDETYVATRDDAKSRQAEAFRSRRTAVKFAGLDRPLKVIQVTSSSQGEGKTTAVANLAIALAQGGDRVAVVCCDLRRPKVQSRFGVALTPGLTDVLVGDATLSEALKRYDANVLILPAGSPPPNAPVLLSTNRAAAVIKALAEEFDVVLIDSTPVLPVTDALVVSEDGRRNPRGGRQPLQHR